MRDARTVPLQERVRHRLNVLMHDRQVPHETLAKYLGLSRSQVTRLLNDEGSGIALPHIEKVCEFFQLTPCELINEPSSLIQEVKPLEAQLLTHFRAMSELQRISLLSVLDRPLPPKTTRRARLGRPELTDEQQLLIDLYARSNEQARSGILKILRGSAKVGDAERDHPGKT